MPPEFGPAARNKNITLHFEPPASDMRVQIDPKQMRRAVANLLSNAIKYTDADGCVELSVALAGDNVMFSVTDTGIGIPERDIPHVFERFYRA